MTLRARMSAIAATAVALAVVAAAITAWLLTRSTLLTEVDRQLRENGPVMGASVIESGDVGWAGGGEARVDADGVPEGAGGIVHSVMTVQAVPMSSMMIDRGGDVIEVFPPTDRDVPVVDASRELLEDGSDEAELSTYSDPETGDEYRVISVPIAGGGVNQVARSLEDVNDTLNRLGLLLTGGAIGGIVIAGFAGWWVSRAGLRPVDRLTDTAERVADSKDLTHRIPVDGRDEIARLGQSINKMLEELDTARVQQQRLVEDAGHELRTPLATLRTDVSLLLRAEQADRSLDPGDREKLLASVEGEVATLSGLVSEVVELARGDTDEEPTQNVDVRELVDRAVERTRRVNAEVRLLVTGSSGEAYICPATIERAISNLVRNALQVTPAGREVEVTVTDAGSAVVIQVCDEGPGIAPDDLPRIFDRFYRGHDARERHGSGLGLAIVRQAVEQHDGMIEAMNRQGVGARLTLRLPKRSRNSGNS